MISDNVASVDSDEPVQSPYKPSSSTDVQSVA